MERLGESIRDPTASWWWLHVRVAGTVPEDGRALRRDQQWSGSAFCGLPAGTGVPISGGMELRTNGEPMPAGLVAMSPWTDLAITGESYTKNREIDPVFGADGGGEMLLHSPYIGENDAKNPLISPMYGNFTGFPPMLIQVGTHEMLYDDAASVAKKAKEQGVPVRFTVYEGMFHVFQMSGTVIPESKRAWEEVGAFMHKVMGQW